MSFTPQRIYEAAFAWSPNKESAYGTALADALFTHGGQPQGFDPPQVTRQYRSDAGKAWGQGADRATTRSLMRQDIAYSLNFELSALLLAHFASCAMGKVVSTQLAAGPPAAYQHVITLQDAITGGVDLPSTGHWFKPGDDLGFKTKGAVCSDFSLSYARGTQTLGLSSNWRGSGAYVNADLSSIPSLDADSVIGPIFEGGLGIKLGAPGSAADISDRVQALSLQVGNGVGDFDGHYPGTSYYHGLAWLGKRTINPSLTIFAKETDDILTLCENDTVQELQINGTGALITGTSYFGFSIVIPALHFGTPQKIGAQGNYVAWELAPGDDGVLDDGVNEPITITVVNKEADFLQTS